jgi:hypothetical protein
MKDNGTIRVSPTGATRDTSKGKCELVKYLSPIVLSAYGQYMLKHQFQSDGTKRAGDNWKKGFGETPQETKDIIIDSLIRHTLDLWLEHDGFESRDGLDEALGGLMFNTIAYWHTELEEKGEIK